MAEKLPCKAVNLLSESSLEFGVLLKDTSTCCQEEATIITGRPALLPELLSPPHTHTSSRQYDRWMSFVKMYIILEDNFFMHFFQALWVFIRNILHDVSGQTEPQGGRFCSYITTVLWVILKDSMYTLKRTCYSCSYFLLGFLCSKPSAFR